MEINPEKISTEMENGIYEQPSLKKYGTMKELTLGTVGSVGDAMGAQIDTSNETVSANTSESIGGDPPYAP